ncbi:5'-3' exonuclease [Jeotgalibacillus soli]|uniref:5'-3' exonuclease n=1 Tax=Jeotgalibacillus soli TaxID=889306 RepID=A0A0C2V567_9BACL|nr:5'-3' exonuclease [Jeotgalibacillus soli]KIL44152.1 5'-3' exonuclease [Jeotgalibacillus soli]
MQKEKHILLIDGMALLFRSYFATAITGQFMVNSNGIPTNAIQGFLRHALTAINQIQPTHVAVCWDMGQKTFRNDLYNGYKANRQQPPVELIPQFDLVKEIAEKFSFVNIGLSGYEADDCIGTIAKSVHDSSKVTIVSGDKDLLQLLDDDIEIWLIKKGYGTYERFDRFRFMEEYEITPAQFIDVKALMGDPSDGFPGVKGIGEKTAFKLIREYSTIEGIIQNINKLTPSLAKKIEQDMEMLHLSRNLAAIHCEVPLEGLTTFGEWNGVPSFASAAIDEYELRAVKRFLSDRLDAAGDSK